MKLKKINLKGYKSIDGSIGQSIPLKDITVLLGANGSGKSNLISFFKLLESMTTGTLQNYVGRQGSHCLLFYGPRKTESIFFRLSFESDLSCNAYEVRLSHSVNDRLFVSEEKVINEELLHKSESSQEYILNTGGAESDLKNDRREPCRILYDLLSGIRTYQFHDTSNNAKIRDRCYVDDARYLRSDAGNLAAFLKMLKEHESYKKYYERIVRHIQNIMPQFEDFSLDPVPGNENYVRLNWKDNSGNDYLFEPAQISDGSLRFMALTTLLLQPPELLPNLIVLDEPELGLHPAAISELAGFVRRAAQKTQVILATQSTRLVDEFPPENMIIAERDENNLCSIFRQLDSEKLKEWVTRYSLSELWEKNILGGQP
jgi:predicted ATPase